MALGNLHFTETGSGRPLLLIHGLFDSLETWEKIVPLLADRFRILAVDLPGFGKSPLPEGWGESLSGMTEAVATFLEEKKRARVAIVGSSMGGSLALAVAARLPERVERLVLLNPYGLPVLPAAPSIARGRFGSLLPFLLSKGVLRRLARAIYRRSLNDPSLVTEELIERVIRPFSSLRRRKELIRFLRGISPEAIQQIDPLLPRINRPVLIVRGENDRWLSEEHAEYLRRRLPQCKVATLPACGHLPQVEKPQETAEAIAVFLESPDPH